ncbi:7360_t:CDS:1, partial [Funneliformis geosporum]
LGRLLVVEVVNEDLMAITEIVSMSVYRCALIELSRSLENLSPGIDSINLSCY